MKPAEDLTGQKFGRLTALEIRKLRIKDRWRVHWLCQCDCGEQRVVKKERLKSGAIVSCGCAKYDKWHDLTGLRYGRLTVKKYLGRAKYRMKLWLCECDCGNTVEVRGQNLNSGHTHSCGCIRGQSKLIDITGEVFGRLTVDSFAGKKPGSNTSYWNCICSCGNTTQVRRGSLKTGNTRSCGCIRSTLPDRLHRPLEANKFEVSREYRINFPEYQGGSFCKIDLALENLKIAIEADGVNYHPQYGYRQSYGTKDFDHDYKRDQKLKELGWEVLRYTDVWMISVSEKELETQVLSDINKVQANRPPALC